MKRIRNTIIIACTGILGWVFATASQDPYFEISKNIDIFVSVYKNINTYYVDQTQPGKLMNTSIEAMLASLDPYTVYYPESDIEDFRFMTTGQYGGIGSLISRKADFIYISEPYEGYPAQKAGLRAGDKILKVDGKSAEGRSTQEVSTLLKGEPNTDLVITVERFGEDKELDFTVTRQEIKIANVPYYGVIKDNIGYIKLNGFTETASAEVKNALTDLKETKQIETVVLDLRGNGGGLLREAVNIVGLFTPQGTKVVETRGKLSDWNQEYRTTAPPIDENIRLFVLVDGGSASASEIVSGTIQDLDRGVIIGTNTFGKGLVQQTRDLKFNSKMKLTVAKYYIPSGRCIQKLDYSHKDADGNALPVPDSLRKEFKTRSGRTVLDGDGVEPDVKVELPKASPILISLVRKQLLFEYATQFRAENGAIPPANEFTLSETQYEYFVKFLDGKDYDYSTKTESLLKKLEAAAEKEKYYDELADDFAHLESEIFQNKSRDLTLFKDQISRYLETEIVSRYYYQTGKIEQSMIHDEYLQSVYEVVLETGKYDAILKGLN